MIANFLENTLLFQGMTTEETNICLKKLNARTSSFQKGEIILLAGDTTSHFGIVQEGSVTIEINDVWGNRTILSHIGAGAFFAETYALLSPEIMLVDVVANSNCTIIWLNPSHIKSTFRAGDEASMKFLSNLLNLSLQKNLLLSKRSFHTSPKNIRGRVLAYLQTLSVESKSTTITLPFDRQQMADYLNVERTALSKELSKMKADALIDFQKNKFRLLLSAKNFLD